MACSSKRKIVYIKRPQIVCKQFRGVHKLEFLIAKRLIQSQIKTFVHN